MSDDFTLRDMFEIWLATWLHDVKQALDAQDYGSIVELTESQVQLFMIDEKMAIPTLLDIVQGGDENLQIAACLFIGFLANLEVSVKHAPKILALVHNRALDDIHSGSNVFVTFATRFALMQYGDQNSTRFLLNWCEKNGLSPADLPQQAIGMIAKLDLPGGYTLWRTQPRRLAQKGDWDDSNA